MGKRFEEYIRTHVATMAMKKMKEYLKQLRIALFLLTWLFSPLPGWECCDSMQVEYGVAGSKLRTFAAPAVTLKVTDRVMPTVLLVGIVSLAACKALFFRQMWTPAVAQIAKVVMLTTLWKRNQIRCCETVLYDPTTLDHKNTLNEEIATVD